MGVGAWVKGELGGLFDMEKQYVFYGEYHSDPVNILIHTLFVWPIFFTVLLFFYFTPPFLPSPAAAVPLAFNLGFAIAALYAVFYVSLDPRAGSLAALLCALCWVGSCILGSHLGFSLAWKGFVTVLALMMIWTILWVPFHFLLRFNVVSHVPNHTWTQPY